MCKSISVTILSKQRFVNVQALSESLTTHFNSICVAAARSGYTPQLLALSALAALSACKEEVVVPWCWLGVCGGWDI
jgi:hypothetical protein